MPSAPSICFFSENGFSGRVPRDHPNMRTEFAWICSLDAVHHPIHDIHNIKENSFDFGIFIIPKNLEHLINYPLMAELKRVCRKVAFMQEGPNWHWQDYSIDIQKWFLSLMDGSDFIFVHNTSDLNYYSGLTSKECFVMPSLIIEDSISNLPSPNRENVIIGGNFCSWYGGHDSYIASKSLECEKFSTSMGRIRGGENGFEDLKHLPFLSWRDWMHALNNFKYGIHLMRTHAAGTFALNCAYLGIPCVGYCGLGSQELCHPDLTVDIGNLKLAKEKLLRLQDDAGFYQECSDLAKARYKKYFSEESYLLKMSKTFSTILNGKNTISNHNLQSK